MSAQAPETEGLLLTAREAARYLGRSARWTYRAAQAGWIPARRCGRSIFFSRPELERWLGGSMNGVGVRHEHQIDGEGLGA